LSKDIGHLLKGCVLPKVATIQSFFAETAFLRLDQTKTPGSFPPEVLLEVSRQTIGIRSCAERERSEPPCSGP
jgi:hypothetical protein